jgi:nitrous oxidase accessory protein NosD
VSVVEGVVAVADAQGGRRELGAGQVAVATTAGLAGRTVLVAPGDGLAGVQRALDAARPGDAILLAAGRYAGGGGVDHALRIAVAGLPAAPITLAGATDGGSVLVSASWQGLAIAGTARHVRVLDLAIEADPAMPTDIVGNGITLRGARQVEIRGCSVRGLPGDGIAALGCDGLHIAGNRITACSQRSPWGQGGISIKSSLSAPGEAALGILVEDNAISGCRDTLPNRNGGGRDYTGGNGIGIWEHAADPAADPPYPGYAGSIVLRGNHSHGNDGAGIRIHASPGVRLVGNRLEGNGLGPGRPPDLAGAESAVHGP